MVYVPILRIDGGEWLSLSYLYRAAVTLCAVQLNQEKSGYSTVTSLTGIAIE
jgi:hypothetical protein